MCHRREHHPSSNERLTRQQRRLATATTAPSPAAAAAATPKQQAAVEAAHVSASALRAPRRTSHRCPRAAKHKHPLQGHGSAVAAAPPAFQPFELLLQRLQESLPAQLVAGGTAKTELQQQQRRAGSRGLLTADVGPTTASGLTRVDGVSAIAVLERAWQDAAESLLSQYGPAHAALALALGRGYTQVRLFIYLSVCL